MTGSSRSKNQRSGLVSRAAAKFYSMRRLSRLQWLRKLGLNNRGINKVLRRAPEAYLDAAGIAHRHLDIPRSFYLGLVQGPPFSSYSKIDFIHTYILACAVSLYVLEPIASGHVLDAACGRNADFLRAVRARSGNGPTLYGQDLTIDLKCEDMTLMEGSVAHIPLPDGCLDAVTCHHSFQHFRNDTDVRFVNEAIRVLKVGGQLIITPIYVTDHYAEIYNSRDGKLGDPAARLIIDTTATLPGWEATTGLARTYSAQALASRIIEPLAGIAAAEVLDVLIDGMPVPDVRRNRQPLLSAGMRALVITKTA